MAQNSYFGQIYVALAAYLKAQVPELKWIDMDLGQLDHFEYKPNVNFPCALIDFPNADYTNESQLVQQGDIIVQFKLGFAPFSQTSQAAPTNVKDKGLVYFDIEQKVFEKVQGWENDITQPFIRLNAATDKRYEEIGLRVRVLTFATSYQDASALVVLQKVDATAQINISEPYLPPPEEEEEEEEEG